MRLRSDPGTYALLLHAPRACSVEVGALGTLAVQPGPHVYVGSALGSGGVRARVRRHARSEKSLHWHIDYVRAVMRLDAVWVTYDAARRECDWATEVRALPEAMVPLDGLGASDCSCSAHLVRLASRSAPARVAQSLRQSAPAHPPVHRIRPPSP
jgi:Uri superfamily endonuclease